MPSIPGLGRGLQKAVNNYYDAQDRERQLTIDREERDYRKNVLRPMQEQNLQQQNELGKLSLDKQRRLAERENVFEALNLAESGEFDAAIQAYNSAGRARIKSIEKHPDDPSGKLLIVENAQTGQKFVLDPDKIRETFGMTKKGNFSESERGILNKDTGAFKPHSFSGAGKLSGSALTSAQRLATSSLTKIYANSFDEMGNASLGNNTGDFTKAEALAHQYVAQGMHPGVAVLKSYEQVTGKRLNIEAAMAQAAQEAEAKAGYFTSDQEDFGPNGRQAWITQRAAEIAGIGGGAQPQARATKPSGPPPEAIKRLRENPHTREDFEKHFGVSADQYLATPIQPTKGPRVTDKKTGASKGASRAQGLMTPQQKQEAEMKSSPSYQKAVREAGIQMNIDDERSARIKRGNQMASRFGLTEGQDRGQAYQAMALAETRVNNAINQKLLPAKEDVELALQFAQGKRDQQAIETYTQILNQYYGS